MRFTLAILGLPVLLALFIVVSEALFPQLGPSVLRGVPAVLLVIAVFIVPLYWLARVVRRAWRDGA